MMHEPSFKQMVEILRPLKSMSEGRDEWKWNAVVAIHEYASRNYSSQWSPCYEAMSICIGPSLRLRLGPLWKGIKRKEEPVAHYYYKELKRAFPNKIKKSRRLEVPNVC